MKILIGGYCKSRFPQCSSYLLSLKVSGVHNCLDTIMGNHGSSKSLSLWSLCTIQMRLRCEASKTRELINQLYVFDKSLCS